MAKRPIKRPIFPRNASRLSLLSLAVALAVLAGAMALYFTGWTQLASPGPLIGAHAAFEPRCEQCHAPQQGVVNLRCERCHDPIDSRRLSTAAHVLAGTGNDWEAAHVAGMSCAACHVDHRGRPVRLQAVSDRECATCHTFGSFARHPEFSLVRSQAASTVGLEFSHEDHLKTLARSGDQSCEVCHQPTADKTGFRPISFDRHCARCHLVNGVLTINGTDPAESGSIASLVLQPLGSPTATVEAPDSRGRQKLTSLHHRDPWVLERLARLTLVLDPTGADTANRRAHVEAALRATEAAVNANLTDVSIADLTTWAGALRTDLADIDRQRASARGEVSADAKAALASLATMAASVDPSLPTQAAAVTNVPPPSPMSDTDRRQALEARRTEIATLLDAIKARGDDQTKRAAAALETRLQTIEPAAASAAPGDDAVLLDRLRALDADIALVERQAGAIEAADLRRLSDLARQQIAPGTGGAEFAARQAELTKLFDALEATADPLMKRRLAELRAALAQLAAGSLGDDSLDRLRAEKARLLDRVTLAISLHDETAGPTPTMVREEMAAAASRETSLADQLADLNATTTRLPALTISSDDARKALGALLDACKTCHTLTPDGTAIQPVRTDLRQLTAANFTHGPHLGQARCESCHASVLTSTSGADTMLPGVTSCQTCHTPGQAGATCASCHTYHASTPDAIGTPVR